MGAIEIILAGSGEPFMHPQIMEILEVISANQLRCNLITNGLLIRKDTAEQLVSLNIHTLTLSLWAGNAASYTRTHPGTSERHFAQIIKMLDTINKQKGKLNSRFPSIKIANVLMNSNHDEIHQMVDFALRVRADQIDFNLIDVIAGKTDSLALSKKEMKSIAFQTDALKKRTEYISFHDHTMKDITQGDELPTEIDNGEKLLMLPENFTFESDRFKIYCPKGQETGMHWYDWNTSHIIFQFNREQCTSCGSTACGIDHTTWTRDVPTLHLSNCRTLGRRTTEQSTHQYDTSILKKIPCYIGWIYARILSNGDVIPCCRAHRKPLGNIFEKPFDAIWQSDHYNQFRDNALHLPKNHHYFNDINCLKGCDNLPMIFDAHRRLDEWNKKRDCSSAVHPLSG